MAIPGPTCNHFRYLNEQLFSLHISIISNPFFEDFHCIELKILYFKIYYPFIKSTYSQIR